MPYQIHFANVGRGKRSWSTVIPILTHSHLLYAIRESGALKSDDISFTFSSHSGVIYAGFHKVGTFTITAGPQNGTDTKGNSPS